MTKQLKNNNITEKRTLWLLFGEWTRGARFGGGWTSDSSSDGEGGG